MNQNQVKNTHVVNQDEDSPFGKRLREAFNMASNKEIADKLHLTKSAMTNYMKGRIPPAETLFDIQRLTNCSLHWLLTGKGGQYPIEIDEREYLIDKDIDYEEVGKRIIEGLKASGKGETEDELLNLAKLPRYIFNPFIQQGFHGQLIYEILALRTNLSLNWIITGEGNRETDSDRRAMQTFAYQIDEQFKEILKKLVKEEISAQNVQFKQFNVEEAVQKYDNVNTILIEWYRQEGITDLSADFGFIFSNWEDRSFEDKVETVKLCKKLADKDVKK